jgi:serine protease Do
LRRTLIAGGFAIAVVAAATGIEAVRSAQASTPGAAAAPAASAAAPIAPQAQTSNVAHELSQAFRSAAGRAAPAVVYVEVEGREQVQTRALPFPLFPDPGQSEPQTRRTLGSGSGFIFRADGYILTNNHVVEEAEKVRVTLQDGRVFDATVQGRDPVTDVAVIKIDATDLPTISLGDSDQMQVGDWVVALGYPLNLGSTATAGIVSAVGKGPGILDRSNPDAPPLEYFIQTDAAINRGNSGGPLVDLQGEVIGINSAIASQTGFYAGYSFAVPSNIVKRVTDDLVKYGEFRRPRLGVRVGPLDQADMEVYKLKSLEGAELVEVQEGLAGEKAGLELGDVVVALDGQKITDSGQLTELLARYRPGDKVKLDIIRYGKPLTVTAELGAFESGAHVARAEAESEPSGVSRLGFSARELTPEVARANNLSETGGVVITAVDPFGPARQQLGRGLVIDKLNGQTIENLDDLEKAAKTVKPGDVVTFIVHIPDDGTRRIINYRIDG